MRVSVKTNSRLRFFSEKKEKNLWLFLAVAIVVAWRRLLSLLNLLRVLRRAIVVLLTEHNLTAQPGQRHNCRQY